MRARRLRLKIVLLLASIGVALLVGEIVLRMLKPLSLGLEHQPAIYQRDPAIGFRYKPNATGWMGRHFEIDNRVTINSRGFHDVEHDLSSDVPRVVVVGDSFTAGLHVPIPETWTQVLQSRLRATRDPSIHVINLGLDGTGTDVHLAILKENLPDLRPDVVIVAFYDDDIADLQLCQVYRELHRGYVLAYQTQEQPAKMRALVDEALGRRASVWLFKRLYLARLAMSWGDCRLLRTNFVTPLHLGERALLHPAYGAGRDPDALFQGFADLSERHGFKLLVLPVPAKHDLEASRKTLRQHVHVGGLAIVDVVPIVRASLAKDGKSYDDLFWRHDGHLNAYGHRVFGLTTAEALSDRLELRRPAGRGSNPPPDGSS